MMPILAAADFSSPIFWAVVIGWIMSVVLHEFGHVLVGHLGGDYTIRERGGLTLNPFAYVDPFLSIVVPLLFLLKGSIALPGGVAYIRRDLLRNRFWQVAVPAAGPVTNLLLFIVLAISLSPRVGWIDPTAPVTDWTTAQTLVGALAFLELFSVLLNLLPIPPLDGFQMLSVLLPRDVQDRARTRSVTIAGFIVLFLLMSSEQVYSSAYTVMTPITNAFGLDLPQLVTATRISLSGHT
jgi:Zn-dependent protease